MVRINGIEHPTPHLAAVCNGFDEQQFRNFLRTHKDDEGVLAFKGNTVIISPLKDRVASRERSYSEIGETLTLKRAKRFLGLRVIEGSIPVIEKVCVTVPHCTDLITYDFADHLSAVKLLSRPQRNKGWQRYSKIGGTILERNLWGLLRYVKSKEEVKAALCHLDPLIYKRGAKCVAKDPVSLVEQVLLYSN